MIREAIIADKQQINNLGLKLNSNYDKLFKLEDILKEDYAKILVYEKENKILGFIHVNILDDSMDIMNIIVDRKYQRQKIGTKLIEYLLTSNDIKKMTLEVRASNNKAISFYKSLGFKIVHVREKYYGNEDGYLMVKEV